MITRKEWGAKKRRYKTSQKSYRPEVYIHHGGTPLGSNTEEGEAAALRSYQQYHMKTRLWSDIAYSFAVAPESGRVYELRGWGNRPGATRNHNKSSYAIVIIGDTSRNIVSDACVEAVRHLIIAGQSAGHISHSVKVLGHRDAKATACPGDSAYARLNEMDPQWAPLKPVKKKPKKKPKKQAPAYKLVRLRKPYQRGAIVKWIQDTTKAPVDGVYGPKSAAAVKRWQKSHKLVADGVVGRKTYKKMASQ
jgi:N-acetylmuramoyl-L-alanine amidase